MMGNWAERAAKRFHDESSDERKTEELETRRVVETRVGAETQWRSLVKWVHGEVKSFNLLMGRDFLEFLRLEDEVEVHAPKLWLSFWIDSPTLQIKFSFQEPYPSLKKIRLGSFPIKLVDEKVINKGHDELEQTLEMVGASLLDPLIG